MPRSVELFAGGGGMALGMHKAGFEHEQLVEISASACEILHANSGSRWKNENVREMDVQAWLREAPKLGLNDVDLVAGGPPCQPFSISGRHAGERDHRNMFPAAIEAIRILRPKLFVFENVPGLLRESFLPYFEYIEAQLRKPTIRKKADESWREHCERLQKARRVGLSYRVERQELNAADFGVPQVRRRVFLIGIRSDIATSTEWAPVPTKYSEEALLHAQWADGSYWKAHGLAQPAEHPKRYAARIRKVSELLIPPTQPRWRTTRDAIADLPEPVDYTEAEGVLNHWGIPGARIYKGHTGSEIDRPSKTLKAGVHGVCGGEGMIRFPDDSVRYFTVREAARVQSFPDDYEVPGVRTQAMKALGNAVAVDVAAAIGEHLRGVTGL